jgi:hypothetical protein
VSGTPRRARARRVSVGLFTALIAIGSLGVEPVLAEAQTTTTTMSVEPTSIDYDESYTLHATVTPDGPASDGSDPSGTVHWHIFVDQMNQPVIASAQLVEGETEVSAVPNFVPQPGVNTFYAEFDPDDSTVWWSSNSELVALTVGQAPSTTTIEGPTTVELNDEIELYATVDSWVSDSTGTVNFYEVGDVTPICSVPTSVPWSVPCFPTADTLGTTSYYAEYTGGTKVSDSTSDPIEVTVTDAVVHGRDFNVQYATFYPVNDGYRDTVTISAFRDEDISGTVKIYKPNGALIKTFTVTLTGGEYSFSWNGRDGSGDIYPEGKYKVVHRLEDTDGATKSVTQYVTLSKKKLIWHSDSITKKGSAFDAKGKAGDGSVAVDTGAGSVRLKTPNGFDGDWSAVGYQFKLPGVTQKDIKLSVYARYVFFGGYVTQIGAQDFEDCALSSSWSEGCFDRWNDLSNASSTRKWFSTKALEARNVAESKVRSLVSNRSGTTYVYKARATFKYATLGY